MPQRGEVTSEMNKASLHSAKQPPASLGLGDHAAEVLQCDRLGLPATPPTSVKGVDRSELLGGELEVNVSVAGRDRRLDRGTDFLSRCRDTPRPSAGISTPLFSVSVGTSGMIYLASLVVSIPLRR